MEKENSIKTTTEDSDVDLKGSQVILDCSFDENEFAEDYEYFDPNVSSITLRTTVCQTANGEKECREILNTLQ
jgi:hypothetical protein